MSYSTQAQAKVLLDNILADKTILDNIKASEDKVAAIKEYLNINPESTFKWINNFVETVSEALPVDEQVEQPKEFKAKVRVTNASQTDMITIQCFSLKDAIVEAQRISLKHGLNTKLWDDLISAKTEEAGNTKSYQQWTDQRAVVTVEVI